MLKAAAYSTFLRKKVEYAAAFGSFCAAFYSFTAAFNSISTAFHPFYTAFWGIDEDFIAVVA